MKKMVFVMVSLVFVLASCAEKSMESAASNEPKGISQSTEGTVRDGMFIHISQGYDDPHRVLMPLKMANMMAADKDVLVYLDIHAVNLVLKTSEDMVFADFDPLKKQLQDLLDKNVGIYACPTCLKIAGYSPDDLLEGIQIANKESFFDFTKGRIITLDY